jgi:hypothetical protein
VAVEKKSRLRAVEKGVDSSKEERGGRIADFRELDRNAKKHELGFRYV